MVISDFKKVIAVLTTILFISTSINFNSDLYAQPMAMSLPALDINKITVNGSAASLEERFQGSEGPERRTVIAVQDAHGIFDAQENIRVIIQELQDQYGFELVGLEGGVGKSDHTFLRTFPDKEINQEQARKYMKRAELSGGEAAAILNPKPGIFYGIENRDLYFQNRNSFIKALELKDANVHAIDLITKKLDKQASDIFPEKLLAFHKAFQKFKSSRMDLLEFVTILQSESAAIAVTPGQYPNVLRLFEAIAKARQAGNKEAVAKAVETATSQIEGRVLFEEIDQLSNSVFLSFRRRPESREIEELLTQYNELQILRNLVSLQLTRKEYLEFLQLDSGLRRNDNYKDLQLTPAETFYRDAVKRDQALYDNFIAAMKHEKKDRAIIVTGGFHEEGLRERLRKENISYVFYMPRIQTITPQDDYYRVMSGKVSYNNKNGRTSSIQAILATMGLDPKLEKEFNQAYAVGGLRALAKKVGSADGLEPYAKIWQDAIIKTIKERGETLRDPSDLIALVKNAVQLASGKVNVDDMLNQLEQSFNKTLSGEARDRVNQFIEALKKNDLNVEKALAVQGRSLGIGEDPFHFIQENGISNWAESLRYFPQLMRKPRSFSPEETVFLLEIIREAQNHPDSPFVQQLAPQLIDWRLQLNKKVIDEAWFDWTNSAGIKSGPLLRLPPLEEEGRMLPNVLAGLKFSKDGREIEIFDVIHNGIFTWNIETGQTKFIPFPGTVSAQKKSADGRYRVTGDRDGFIKLWDLKTQTVLKSLDTQKVLGTTPSAQILTIAINSDGSRVAFGREDDPNLRIWNPMTDDVIELRGHPGSTAKIIFSPDGKSLISGGGSYRDGDNRVRKWNVENGAEIQVTWEHDHPITSLELNADGTRLATATQLIKIWNAQSSELIREIPVDEANSIVSKMSFSPDGKYLAVAIDNDRYSAIKIFDLATGKVVYRYAQVGRFIVLDFNPIGSELAFGSLHRGVSVLQAPLKAPYQNFESRLLPRPEPQPIKITTGRSLGARARELKPDETASFYIEELDKVYLGAPVRDPAKEPFNLSFARIPGAKDKIKVTLASGGKKVFEAALKAGKSGTVGRTGALKTDDPNLDEKHFEISLNESANRITIKNFRPRAPTYIVTTDGKEIADLLKFALRADVEKRVLESSYNEKQKRFKVDEKSLTPQKLTAMAELFAGGKEEKKLVFFDYKIKLLPFILEDLQNELNAERSIIEEEDSPDFGKLEDGLSLLLLEKEISGSKYGDPRNVVPDKSTFRVPQNELSKIKMEGPGNTGMKEYRAKVDALRDAMYQKEKSAFDAVQAKKQELKAKEFALKQKYGSTFVIRAMALDYAEKEAVKMQKSGYAPANRKTLTADQVLTTLGLMRRLDIRYEHYQEEKRKADIGPKIEEARALLGKNNPKEAYRKAAAIEREELEAAGQPAARNYIEIAGKLQPFGFILPHTDFARQMVEGRSLGILYDEEIRNALKKFDEDPDKSRASVAAATVLRRHSGIILGDSIETAKVRYLLAWRRILWAFFENEKDEKIRAMYQPDLDQVEARVSEMYERDSEGRIPSLRTFEGHEDWVNAVTFSANGRRLLTGSNDGTVRLWDIETGDEIRRFEGNEGSVYSIAISADEKLLLVGSHGETVRLLDAETGEEIRGFEGHQDLVESVAISADGKRVLTGSGRTASLWDAETGEEIHQFEGGRERNISSVAFNANRKRILTGSYDGTARLWDAETGKEIRKFEGHRGPVKSVVSTTDGERVLTGSYDGTARLWNAETGKEIRKFEGREGEIFTVAFSPNEKRILIGGGNGASLLDINTGQEIRRFEGHGDTVSSVAFSPDGRKLVTGSWDGTAKLWNQPLRPEFRDLAKDFPELELFTKSPIMPAKGASLGTGSSVIRKVNQLTGDIKSLQRGKPYTPEEYKDLEYVTVIEGAKRAGFIGDVQGNFKEMKEAILKSGFIDDRGNWIAGDAVFAFAGDLVDSGPESAEVLDFIMKLRDQAARAGGRVIAVRGNHDDMMLQTLESLKDVPDKSLDYAQIHVAGPLWWPQGGKETAISFLKKAGIRVPKEDKDIFIAFRKYMNSPTGKTYLAFIRNLPYAAKVNNVLLVHGGPDFDAKNLRELGESPESRKTLSWIRRWEGRGEDITEFKQNMGVDFIVYGHTQQGEHVTGKQFAGITDYENGIFAINVLPRAATGIEALAVLNFDDHGINLIFGKDKIGGQALHKSVTDVDELEKDRTRKLTELQESLQDLESLTAGAGEEAEVPTHATFSTSLPDEVIDKLMPPDIPIAEADRLKLVKSLTNEEKGMLNVMARAAAYQYMGEDRASRKFAETFTKFRNSQNGAFTKLHPDNIRWFLNDYGDLTPEQLYSRFTRLMTEGYQRPAEDPLVSPSIQFYFPHVLSLSQKIRQFKTLMEKPRKPDSRKFTASQFFRRVGLAEDEKGFLEVLINLNVKPDQLYEYMRMMSITDEFEFLPFGREHDDATAQAIDDISIAAKLNQVDVLDKQFMNRVHQALVNYATKVRPAAPAPIAPGVQVTEEQLAERIADSRARAEAEILAKDPLLTASGTFGTVDPSNPNRVFVPLEIARMSENPMDPDIPGMTQQSLDSLRSGYSFWENGLTGNGAPMFISNEMGETMTGGGSTLTQNEVEAVKKYRSVFGIPAVAPNESQRQFKELKTHLREFGIELRGNFRQHQGGNYLLINRILTLIPPSLKNSPSLRIIDLNGSRVKAARASAYDDETSRVVIYPWAMDHHDRRLFTALVIHEIGHSIQGALDAQELEAISQAHAVLGRNKAFIHTEYFLPDRAGYQYSFPEFFAEMNLIYISRGDYLRSIIQSHPNPEVRAAYQKVYDIYRNLHGREYSESRAINQLDERAAALAGVSVADVRRMKKTPEFPGPVKLADLDLAPTPARGTPFPMKQVGTELYEEKYERLTGSKTFDSDQFVSIGFGSQPVSGVPHINVTPDAGNPENLIIRVSFGQGNSEYKLEKGQKKTIGRGNDVDIRMIDPRISRHHAEISLSADGSKITIKDMGSANGTFIPEGLRNTERVVPATVTAPAVPPQTPVFVRSEKAQVINVGKILKETEKSIRDKKLDRVKEPTPEAKSEAEKYLELFQTIVLSSPRQPEEQDLELEQFLTFIGDLAWSEKNRTKVNRIRDEALQTPWVAKWIEGYEKYVRGQVANFFSANQIPPEKLTFNKKTLAVTVNLTGIKISDVSALSKIKNLRTVYLAETSVSDLTPLTANAKLDRVYLRGSYVMPEAAEAFRQAHPNPNLRLVTGASLGAAENAIDQLPDDAIKELKLDNPEAKDELIRNITGIASIRPALEAYSKKYLKWSVLNRKAQREAMEQLIARYVDARYDELAAIYGFSPDRAAFSQLSSLVPDKISAEDWLAILEQLAARKVPREAVRVYHQSLKGLSGIGLTQNMLSHYGVHDLKDMVLLLTAPGNKFVLSPKIVTEEQGYQALDLLAQILPPAKGASLGVFIEETAPTRDLSTVLTVFTQNVDQYARQHYENTEDRERFKDLAFSLMFYVAATGRSSLNEDFWNWPDLKLPQDDSRPKNYYELAEIGGLVSEAFAESYVEPISWSERIKYFLNGMLKIWQIFIVSDPFARLRNLNRDFKFDSDIKTQLSQSNPRQWELIEKKLIPYIAAKQAERRKLNYWPRYAARKISQNKRFAASLIGAVSLWAVMGYFIARTHAFQSIQGLMTRENPSATAETDIDVRIVNHLKFLHLLDQEWARGEALVIIHDSRSSVYLKIEAFNLLHEWGVDAHRELPIVMSAVVDHWAEFLNELNLPVNTEKKIRDFYNTYPEAAVSDLVQKGAGYGRHYRKLIDNSIFETRPDSEKLRDLIFASPIVESMDANLLGYALRRMVEVEHDGRPLNYDSTAAFMTFDHTFGHVEDEEDYGYFKRYFTEDLKVIDSFVDAMVQSRRIGVLNAIHQMLNKYKPEFSELLEKSKTPAGAFLKSDEIKKLRDDLQAVINKTQRAMDELKTQKVVQGKSLGQKTQISSRKKTSLAVVFLLTGLMALPFITAGPGRVRQTWNSGKLRWLEWKGRKSAADSEEYLDQRMRMLWDLKVAGEDNDWLAKEALQILGEGELLPFDRRFSVLERIQHDGFVDEYTLMKMAADGDPEKVFSSFLDVMQKFGNQEKSYRKNMKSPDTESMIVLSKFDAMRQQFERALHEILRGIRAQNTIEDFIAVIHDPRFQSIVDKDPINWTAKILAMIQSKDVMKQIYFEDSILLSYLHLVGLLNDKDKIHEYRQNGFYALKGRVEEEVTPKLKKLIGERESARDLYSLGLIKFYSDEMQKKLALLRGEVKPKDEFREADVRELEETFENISERVKEAIKKNEGKSLGAAPVTLTPEELAYFEEDNENFHRKDGSEVLIRPRGAELDLMQRLQGTYLPERYTEKLDLGIAGQDVLAVPGYSINGFLLAEYGNPRSVTVVDKDQVSIAWLKAIKKYWNYRESPETASVGEIFISGLDYDRHLKDAGKIPQGKDLNPSYYNFWYMIQLIQQGIKAAPPTSEFGPYEWSKNISFRAEDVNSLAPEGGEGGVRGYDFVFIPWLIGLPNGIELSEKSVTRALDEIQKVSKPGVRIMITPAESFDGWMELPDGSKPPRGFLADLLRKNGYEVEDIHLLAGDETYLIARPASLGIGYSPDLAIEQANEILNGKRDVSRRAAVAIFNFAVFADKNEENRRRFAEAFLDYGGIRKISIEEKQKIIEAIAGATSAADAVSRLGQIKGNYISDIQNRLQNPTGGRFHKPRLFSLAWFVELIDFFEWKIMDSVIAFSVLFIFSGLLIMEGLVMRDFRINFDYNAWKLSYLTGSGLSAAGIIGFLYLLKIYKGIKIFSENIDSDVEGWLENFEMHPGFFMHFKPVTGTMAMFIFIEKQKEKERLIEAFSEEFNKHFYRKPVYVEEIRAYARFLEQVREEQKSLSEFAEIHRLELIKNFPQFFPEMKEQAEGASLGGTSSNIPAIPTPVRTWYESARQSWRDFSDWMRVKISRTPSAPVEVTLEQAAIEKAADRFVLIGGTPDPDRARSLREFTGLTAIAWDEKNDVYSPISQGISFDFAGAIAGQVREMSGEAKKLGRPLRVLVIGSGTGLDALTAAHQAKMNGLAADITATDIHAPALANTKFNMETLAGKPVEVHQVGPGRAGVEAFQKEIAGKTYDLILFNAPDAKPADSVIPAAFNTQMNENDLREILDASRALLAPDGVFLLRNLRELMSHGVIPDSYEPGVLELVSRGEKTHRVFQLTAKAASLGGDKQQDEILNKALSQYYLSPGNLGVLANLIPKASRSKRGLRRLMRSPKDYVEISRKLHAWVSDEPPRHRRLEVQNAYIHAMAMSPDGQYALTGSEDGNAILWRVSDGEKIHTFVHQNYINSVAFSPSGEIIAVGTDIGVFLWKVNTREQIRIFGDHAKRVAFSANGESILVSSDRTLSLWDVNSGERLREFDEEHEIGISSIAISPDGRYVLSGDDNGRAIFWEMATGKKVRNLKGPFSSITSVTISPDGKNSVIAESEGSVSISNLNTGKKIKRFDGESSLAVFTPDGKFVVTGNEYSSFGNETVQIWNADTGEWELTLDSHNEDTEHGYIVAVSPDGRSLITSINYNDQNHRHHSEINFWYANLVPEFRQYEQGLFPDFVVPPGTLPPAATGRSLGNIPVSDEEFRRYERALKADPTDKSARRALIVGSLNPLRMNAGKALKYLKESPNPEIATAMFWELKPYFGELINDIRRRDGKGKDDKDFLMSLLDFLSLVEDVPQPWGVEGDAIRDKTSKEVTLIRKQILEVKWADDEWNYFKSNIRKQLNVLMPLENRNSGDGISFIPGKKNGVKLDLTSITRRIIQSGRLGKAWYLRSLTMVFPTVDLEELNKLVNLRKLTLMGNVDNETVFRLFRDPKNPRKIRNAQWLNLEVGVKESRFSPESRIFRWNGTPEDGEPVVTGASLGETSPEVPAIPTPVRTWFESIRENWNKFSDWMRTRITRAPPEEIKLTPEEQKIRASQNPHYELIGGTPDPDRARMLREFTGLAAIAWDEKNDVYSPISQGISFDFAGAIAQQMKDMSGEAKKLDHPLRVLVIGSGTGLDVLTAAHQAKANGLAAEITATDIHAPALANTKFNMETLAEKPVEVHQVGPGRAGVEAFQKEIAGKTYDLILFNAPDAKPADSVIPAAFNTQMTETDLREILDASRALLAPDGVFLLRNLRGLAGRGVIPEGYVDNPPLLRLDETDHRVYTLTAKAASLGSEHRDKEKLLELEHAWRDYPNDGVALIRLMGEQLGKGLDLASPPAGRLPDELILSLAPEFFKQISPRLPLSANPSTRRRGIEWRKKIDEVRTGWYSDQFELGPAMSGAEEIRSWSPDGKRLAVRERGRYRIVNAETLEDVGTHTFDRIGSWSLDGSRLTVGDGQWWRIVNGQTLEDIGIRIFDAIGSWSPDGSRLAVKEGHQWRIINDETLEPVGTRTFDEITSWSPDGKRLAVREGGRYRIVNAETLEDMGTRTFDEIRLWSPDGKRLAVRERGRYRIVNAETLEDVGTRTFDRIGSWSPDGSRLAVVDGEGLRIVNGKTFENVGTRTFMVIKSWSPDGSRVVVRARAREQLVNSETGENVGTQSFDWIGPWSLDGSRLLVRTPEGLRILHFHLREGLAAQNSKLDYNDLRAEGLIPAIPTLEATRGARGASLGQFQPDELQFLAAELGFGVFEGKPVDVILSLTKKISADNIDDLGEALLNHILLEIPKIFEKTLDSRLRGNDSMTVRQLISQSKQRLSEADALQVADELLNQPAFENLTGKPEIKSKLVKAFMAIVQGAAAEIVEAGVKAEESQHAAAVDLFSRNFPDESTRESIESIALQKLSEEQKRLWIPASAGMTSERIQLVMDIGSLSSVKQGLELFVGNAFAAVPERSSLNFDVLYTKNNTERVNAMRSYIEDVRKKLPEFAAKIRMKASDQKDLIRAFQGYQKRLARTKDQYLIFIVPDVQMVADLREAPVIVMSDEDIPEELSFVRGFVSQAAVGLAKALKLPESDARRQKYLAYLAESGITYTKDPQTDKILFSINLQIFVQHLVDLQRAQAAVLKAA